jgi:hypothetical protein
MEQPYLLDPYLEHLVQPAMERLCTLIRRYDDHAQQHNDASNSNGNDDNTAITLYLSEVESNQIYIICHYLQVIMKIRGYKTIGKNL